MAKAKKIEVEGQSRRGGRSLDGGLVGNLLVTDGGLSVIGSVWSTWTPLNPGRPSPFKNENFESWARGRSSVPLVRSCNSTQAGLAVARPTTAA